MPSEHLRPQHRSRLSPTFQPRPKHEICLISLDRTKQLRQSSDHIRTITVHINQNRTRRHRSLGARKTSRSISPRRRDHTRTSSSRNRSSFVTAPVVNDNAFRNQRPRHFSHNIADRLSLVQRRNDDRHSGRQEAQRLQRNPQFVHAGGGALVSKPSRKRLYSLPFQMSRSVSCVASPSVKAP